ncbi:MAG: RNA polymerase sigma factor [Elusimicrobiota bacterium]|jgi:RNA polymerase sigma-70 factor (ECF subfamily)
METPQNESEDPDSLLVDRFIGGDNDAFHRLFTRYKGKMLQFVRWYAGGDRDAEDIVQEIFMEAFKSLKSFRRQSAFNTWLYGLARNVCLHHARKRGKMKILQEPEDFLEIPDPADHQAALERAESELNVRAAVESLPPLYRAILLLREWEQMSYADIAMTLQVPLGTVRSRLHNATVLLAGTLRGEASSAKEDDREL